MELAQQQRELAKDRTDEVLILSTSGTTIATAMESFASRTTIALNNDLHVFLRRLRKAAYGGIVFVGLVSFTGEPSSAQAMNLNHQGLISGVTLDRNCSDYGTREAAGRDLEAEPPEGRGDRFGLDRDGDGIACELLPRGLLWTAVPAGVAFLLLMIREQNRTKLRTEFASWILGPWLIAGLSMLVFSALVIRLPRATPAVVFSFVGIGVAVIADAIWGRESKDPGSPYRESKNGQLDFEASTDLPPPPDLSSEASTVQQKKASATPVKKKQPGSIKKASATPVKKKKK